MKKEIGDFTIREAIEYCKKQECCWDCPFKPYCHKHGAMTRINESDLIVKVWVDER